MKRLILWLLVIMAVATTLVLQHSAEPTPAAQIKKREKEEKYRTRFYKERLQYEFDMIKDPRTGKVPEGIFEKERAFARTIPERGGAGDNTRPQNLNGYIPAGPNNIGGRTRAIVYDLRYNGGFNRVILSGSVSGGILRSADGGSTWTRVSPENDIHNLTALVQDPTNPDVWYAGGGEAYGNTTDELGAPYLGYGIWKSSNNGVSWSRLTFNVTNYAGTGPVFSGNVLETFDHAFDYVHRIAVNPVNGHVYIAGHRRIIRSTDGGTSFRVVFEGTAVANSASGQCDIAITSSGLVIVANNGSNPDLNFRGVWVSATGNPGAANWTRIAGGSTLGVDSVAGWRANSYEVIAAGTPPTYSSRRIILALAPSDNNVAYFFYENGLSSESPDLKPEADFFRLDIAGSTYTWSNRSANMPDFPNGNLSGSDPITLQGGYNMEVRVKPDNPNVVFVGGTNLYRSTDGFSTTANTAWIGGYQSNFSYSQYPNSHADIHFLAFNPANAASATCANDGGIQFTTDIMAATVAWSIHPNYQTLQYYNVAIDPGAGRNNFAGGSQDNGVRYRDKTGILGTAPADSNNHRLLFSADGATVGISTFDEGSSSQYLYESLQFGNLRRVKLGNPPNTSADIKPAGLTTSSQDVQDQFGEFVTNFRLVVNNTEDLYYVNFNRLFRTTSATTVTSSTGWTELTGVSQAVNPGNATGGRNVGIRGTATTRGPYTSGHVLYLGTTNGKIFRLNDPRNAPPATAPADITPPLPAGQTNLGNVQDIAVNPNNDNEVMAVVSNYNVVSIWWTNNAKAASPTWRNLEGNLTLPSVRSCMIVVRKDAANNPVTEYYVGTSVGLYSTIDISGTPTWVREGGNVLNYAVVQSIAYRPVDNVLLIGTHGNGMYYSIIGSANFSPNVGTGINDPISNDRNFIREVFPTNGGPVLYYNTGNLTGIRRISVQVMNMAGQIVYRSERGYEKGSVNVHNLAGGHYLFVAWSDDGKYRHVQKFLRK